MKHRNLSRKRRKCAVREEVIRLAPEGQLAFWKALMRQPKLTPEQCRLGAIIRGRVVSACPVGTIDNSPAIHRWGGGCVKLRPRPVGTVEEGRRGAVSHTYVNALFHCTFSTKGRRQLIVPELQERLWPFMGGIAREQGFKALAVGGVVGTTFTCCSRYRRQSPLPGDQLIKGALLNWVHDPNGT